MNAAINVMNVYRRSQASSQGFGLLSQLLNQPGNGSTDIKIKLGYGYSASNTNWNPASTYNAGTIRTYPSDSPIAWKVKAGQSVGAGESPPISNSKWELAIAIEMIQNLGGGKYASMSVMEDEGFYRKLGPMNIGTYSLSSFSYNESIANYDGLTISTTSASSITTPTAHPSARTFTVGTGLTLQQSATIGTCNDTFSIPTTHPTFMTRTLPTGLSLAPGQSVTFYGNANNFFVGVVCRYFPLTGEFYGFSTLHVGSGSFSSWTLKTEKLIQIFRTANPANIWFGLIQTYDSGTGVMVANSVSNTGTGTFSGWTINQYKEPAAPLSAQSEFYTGANAGWHVATVKGTQFAHRCTTDNRGTGFTYIYCSGPNISSPPANVTIDTYSVATLTDVQKVIFSDLLPGTHVILGVIIPSPTLASANTRPWIKASTNPANVPSFNQFYNFDLFTADFNALTSAFSIGEFAWRFRKEGEVGDTYEWMPYHGNDTMSVTAKSLVVDGVTIDETANFTSLINPYQLKYQSFETCVLTQVGDMIHYQEVGSLGTYNAVFTIDRLGIDYSASFNWTSAIRRTIGYTMMLFLPKAFAKKLKFGKTGNVYTPAGIDLSIAPADLNPGSVLVYNDGTGVLGEANYALANYSGQTTMPWLTSSFIDNYDAEHIKLYPVTQEDALITAGTTEIVKGKWYIGNKGTLV